MTSSSRNGRYFWNLSDEDIHIWITDLASFCRPMAYLRQLLPKTEIDRCEKFHFERDRKIHAASRFFLRRTLALYLNSRVESVLLTANKNGKPYLDRKGHAEIVNFNLSHSGTVMAIAVAAGCEVGVDIEYLDEEFPVSLVAPKLVGMDPSASFDSSANGTGAESFYRQWTRTEALLKGVGTGIGGLTSTPTTSLMNWSLRSFRWGNKYLGAVANEGPARNLKLFFANAATDEVNQMSLECAE